jgi:hypothetical protein
VVLHAAILGLGVAAVAIPIAIHLLVKRKKPPMPWGAMRFVQLAIKQTRRRMMLERWLLLACRCLLVLAAAVALARPLWSSSANSAVSGGQVVYVVIDNSLASGATDAQGVTDLRRSIAAARVMLESLSPGDQAALVTAARPAQGVIVPASSNIASVISVLEALEPTSSTLDVRGAMSVVSASIERAQAASSMPASTGVTFVHLISQWRGSSRLLADPQTTLLTSSSNASEQTTANSGNIVLVVHPPATDATLSTTGIGGVRLQRPLVLQQTTAMAGSNAAEPAAQAVTTSSPTAIVTIDVIRSGASVNQEQTTDVDLQVLPTLQAAGRAAPESAGPNDRRVSRVRASFAPGQRSTSVIAAVPIDAPSASTSASGVATPNSSLQSGFVLQAKIIASTTTSGPVRDSLTADNDLYRGLVIKPAIRIGIVADNEAWSQPARQAWRLGTLSGESVDAFTPGHWLSLALQPSLAEQSVLQSTSAAIGGLQLIDLEEGPIDRSVLGGLDAVMVLSPQVLASGGATSAWSALREFVDLGGVVLVMPPVSGSLDAWTPALISAFNLDWTFAGVRQAPQDAGNAGESKTRWPLLIGESRDRDATTALSPSPAANPSANTDAAKPSEGDLLTALRGELAELAQAVSFEKLASPQRRSDQASPASQTGTETITYLTSTDGQGVLLAARPKPDGGMLLYLATALDLGWTDLVAKPLMVPLMQEIVRQGVGLSVVSAGISGSQGQVNANITAGQRASLRPGLRMQAKADRAATSASPIAADEPIFRAGVYPVEDETGKLRGALTVQPAITDQLLDAPESASVLRYARQLIGESNLSPSAASNVVVLSQATTTSVRDELRKSGEGASSRSAFTSDASHRASSSLLIAIALLAALVEIVFARLSSQPAKADPSGLAAPALSKSAGGERA